MSTAYSVSRVCMSAPLLINNVCALTFALTCLRHLSEPDQSSFNDIQARLFMTMKIKSSNFVLITDEWKRKNKIACFLVEKL